MQLTERPPNLLLQSGQAESIDDVELDLEPGNHQLQELLLSGELDRTGHKSSQTWCEDWIVNHSNITEIKSQFQSQSYD